MWRVVAVIVVLGLAGAGFAAAPSESVDLLQALNSGKVWAEFHGAGDRAVTGTVERAEDGPTQLHISPGTQFWAQASGRQGQTNLGRIPIDLSQDRVAYLNIRTCCTNLGRPPATPEDVMVPVSCPDPRMATLLGLPGVTDRPHMAVQAAVWAIANNPRRSEVRLAVRTDPTAGTTSEERSRFADEALAVAADLLQAAGLVPASFRAFR